jgi:hypothetical protein
MLTTSIVVIVIVVVGRGEPTRFSPPPFFVVNSLSFPCCRRRP